VTLYVLGATGFTGSLICKSLALKGIEFVAVARSFEKAQMLWELLEKPNGMKILALRDFTQLADSLSEGDALINTVGPFESYGPDMLPALLRNKALNYVDVTGEIHFVKWIFETSKRENWCSLVVPSCAFESYLADMMMKKIAKESRVSEWSSIESYYSTTPPRPSPGTRNTMKLSRSKPSWTWTNLQRKEMRSGDVEYRIEETLEEKSKKHWASSVSYPEVYFWEQEYNTNSGMSFHHGPEHLMRSLSSASSLQSALPASPEKTERQENPFEERWRRMNFEIILNAVNKENVSYSRKLIGKDPYGITAEIAIACALSMQSQSNDSLRTGCYSPAQVFGLDHFEKIIAENAVSEQTIQFSREKPKPV